MAGDPKTSRRALRVGLLLHGNLVEERLFTDGLPITIGQSLKCRLSVPVDGMPLEHVLFGRDQDRWLLHVTKAMTGRIAQGERIVTELPPGPLPLERGVRGRLSLGDATILFQEIAALPAQPRPQLPASVRGTFADRIDRRLAVIISGSIIAHLGIAAWAWATESEEPPPGQISLADFHQETMEIQLPDDLGKPVTSPPSTEPGTATPVSPKQVTQPIVHPTHVVPPGPPDPSHLAEEAKKFAALLTGDEISAHGTSSDMAHHQPGADLGKQISEVRDGHYTIGEGTHGSRDPQFRKGTGHDPQIDNPDQLAHNDHVDREPPPMEIKPKPPTGPGTTLTIAEVLGKINGPYMAGLQRCHKAGLLKHGDISGKISVTFVVDEHGRVSEATAEGIADDVDTCVRDQMLRWHFTQPRDKDGDPTDAPFSLALILRSN